MARVKDTGPSSGSAIIPAAGKQKDKKKSIKSTEAKATIPDSKPAPAKTATKAKKAPKTDVEPNETGHPIHSAVNIPSEDGSDPRTAKSKTTKAKGKKAAGSDNSEDAAKDEGSNAVGEKSTKTVLKKAAKGATKIAENATTQVEPTVLAAKDVVEKTVSKGKRKIAAIVEDDDESGTKKAKKAGSKSSKDNPDKEKKTSRSTNAVQPEGSSSKKRKAAEDDDTIQVVSSPIAGSSKKQKKSTKKGSSTILDTVGSVLDSAIDVVTGGQTSILEDVAESAKNAADSKSSTKKSALKKTKEAKSALEPTAAELEDDGVPLPEAHAEQEQDEEDEWEPEQEIAQLITGFETASEDEESGDEGFKLGNEVPKLPKQKALTAKERQSKSDGPGVIYVGRVPHGFHEHEMRSYFSQFGDVNHVRLSRSKKTGRSKHYAFLEFKSEEVAKIAAKTMDKYLLYGHILRCSFVPQEQVHPSLWKGADKRFKAVPWARIEGRKLMAPKGRTEWQKKVEKETKRRASKAEKLKEIGYEYEPTKLTSVDDVPVQPSKHLENGTVEEEKTVVVGKEGNSIVVSEEVKTKKAKKGKQAKQSDEKASQAIEPQSSAEDGKRIKKPSKRAIEASVDAPAPKKGKKAKV